MKYIFRGNILFEYFPNERFDKVKLGLNKDLNIPNWNYCTLINEDYKLLSEYFDTVYKHSIGEEVELKDIEVY